MPLVSIIVGFVGAYIGVCWLGSLDFLKVFAITIEGEGLFRLYGASSVLPSYR
jgi:hypothetical protein